MHRALPKLPDCRHPRYAAKKLIPEFDEINHAEILTAVTAAINSVGG